MPSTRVIPLPLPLLGRELVNAHLLLGRRPVVVDSGIPGQAPLIAEQLARHGVDPQDVTLVVITHGHIDHFGSAAALARLTGAPLAAHEGDLAEYHAGRTAEPMLPTGPMGRTMMRSPNMHARIEGFVPDIVLCGPLDLTEYGVDARIVPTPGHTPGSVSVLTDAGELVAGDLVANAFMGLIPGRPANPPFHDDALQNLRSLQAMLDLDPVRLHVGHGPALEPARVRRWAVAEHRRLARQARRGRLRTRTTLDT